MKLSNKIIAFLLGGGVLLAGAVVLYVFPPGLTPFYPRCMFHQATGLSCPGCGTLRAAHALLHGHVQEAFALNPLLFLLLPILAWIGISQWLQARTGRGLSHPFRHPVWVWVLVGVIVVFSVVRNLPGTVWPVSPP